LGSGEGSSQGFDSPTVHAQIGMTDPRSRADLNGSRFCIEQEFDIVREPEQPRPVFDAQIARLTPDDRGSWFGLDQGQ